MDCQGNSSTGPNRTLDQRHRQKAPRAGRCDAHRTPCFEVHAVDATSTKLLRPEAHYTVFGRFRFVEDDDLEEDDRGFR